MTYRHVLLAAEFDAVGPRMLARVSELLRYGAPRLTLLHVVDERSEGGSELLPTVAGTPEPHRLVVPQGTEENLPLESDTETRLDEAAVRFLQSLAQRLGVPGAQLRVVSSTSVSTAIVAEARAAGVDLIIVGHHDRHWLDWLVAGTAERVVGAAVCDVLVLHTAD